MKMKSFSLSLSLPFLFFSDFTNVTVHNTKMVQSFKIQNGMDMSSTILTILKNCKIDQWELWRQAFTEYKRRMRRIFRRTMLNERSVLASVRMKEQNRFGSYTCTLVNSTQLISFFVLER